MAVHISQHVTLLLQKFGTYYFTLSYEYKSVYMKVFHFSIRLFCEIHGINAITSFFSGACSARSSIGTKYSRMDQVIFVEGSL